MPYRDILVHTDASEASRRRVAEAARIARGCDARLTGVFLRTTFPGQNFAIYDTLSPQVLPDLIHEHEGFMERAAEAARAGFEAALAGTGVAGEWRAVAGDTSQALTEQMRRHELTILPREHPANAAEFGLTPAQLGLGAGGPLLILPDAPEPPPARRAIVAWNGGREVARALNDAWPLLADAEKVFVLTVTPQPASAPDEGLQRHFAAHGIAAVTVAVTGHDASAGEAILRQIKELQANLVVMGLYGHTRMREFVLGGVSRDLLKASPAALLVSH